MNKLYDKISICFVLSHSFKEKLEIFIEADQIQIYDCRGRKKKKKKHAILLVFLQVSHSYPSQFSTYNQLICSRQMTVCKLQNTSAVVARGKNHYVAIFNN